jgi:hypothetical protein
MRLVAAHLKLTRRVLHPTLSSGEAPWIGEPAASPQVRFTPRGDSNQHLKPLASGLLSSSPADDDSAFQPKAVLTVVIAADSELAVVAEAGVKVFGLNQA